MSPGGSASDPPATAALAASAWLRPPHRHPEAPDIAVSGQRAVRVQDDDRKRNDAARDDAHELHVLGHHADTVEPQIAFATILGHGTHPPWWSPRLARMGSAPAAFLSSNHAALRGSNGLATYNSPAL